MGNEIRLIDNSSIVVILDKDKGIYRVEVKNIDKVDITIAKNAESHAFLKRIEGE